MHVSPSISRSGWTRAVSLASAAVLATTLSACGGGSSTNGAKGSGTPVHGDTLTVTIPVPPTTLNPALADQALTDYTLMAYDSLIYRAADGSLQPALAESWKMVGDNNQQLDLKLRSGVTFSDGAPVTAQAVKASLDYAAKAAGPQANMLAALTVSVTGPLSLSIKSSTPNPLLPDTFTQFYGVGEIISPKGLADPKSLSADSASHGAGAYVLDPSGTVAGDHYAYTARSGYYEPDRQHYKKIVVRVIANPQAVVNALKTKQVDVAVAGDPTVSQQVSSAGLKVTSVPFVFQGLSLMDRAGTVSKPLGDVRVRQAINYAIDRETVTKAVLGSQGVPTTQTVVKGADGYSDKAAARYPYDVDKAKQLLTEAGYPNGFALPVASAPFAGIDTMAQAIKGQLAKVGIKVQLKTETDVTAYLQHLTDHKFPAAAIGYGAQPMYLEGQGLFLPTAPVFNGFKTADPTVERLYQQAAAAEPKTRADLDRQIEEYLVDQAWFAPVAFAPVLYFSRSDLGGVRVSGAAPIATPLDWFDTK